MHLALENSQLQRVQISVETIISLWFLQEQENYNDDADLSIPSASESQCAVDIGGRASCDYVYKTDGFVALIEETESSWSVRVWAGMVLEAIKVFIMLLRNSRYTSMTLMNRAKACL